MDAESQKQFRELNDRLSGVTASVETGFATVRRDIHYLTRANVPTLIVAFVALVLSITSTFVALENRSLILKVTTETAKNTRDIENIWPVVWQQPGPVPERSATGK